MDIRSLAAELNRQASAYRIGRLPEIRANLRSLSRVAAKDLFDYRTTHDNYAFHVGGRTELQFNIGTEEIGGDPAIRHGVAFSLQLSQSLPAIDPLLPKLERFNEYVRTNPEDFPQFVMWHYKDAKRSPDYPVAPIPPEVARAGTFIMLGRYVRDSEVDLESILLDFDRLLPLYVYVESEGEGLARPAKPAFNPGCPDFVIKSVQHTAESERQIALRHKRLQVLLFELLAAEAGQDRVAIEHELDAGTRVDAAVDASGVMQFYELKMGPTVQACVRQAVGQLLEYAFFPDETRAEAIVVVGEAKATPAESAYLAMLRSRFDLPISYRRLDLAARVLEAPV